VDREADKFFTTQEARKVLFDNCPVPVCLVSKDGYWLDFNDKALELFEYTRSEFQQLKYENVTAGTDIWPDKQEAQKVIDGESSGYFMHKTYISKTNRPFWALLIVQGIYTKEGDFEYFISYILPVKGWFSNVRVAAKALRQGKKFLIGCAVFIGLLIYKLGIITWEEFLKLLRVFV